MSGKLRRQYVSEMWMSYAAALPPLDQPLNIIQARRAFFAGVQTILDDLLKDNMMGCPPSCAYCQDPFFGHPKPHPGSKLEDMVRELEFFAESVRKGLA